MKDFVRANRDLAGILQQKVFEGPRHVVIDLTNNCNTNCLACWTFSPMLQDENKPPKEWFRQKLDPEVLKALIEDLHEMGVERIRFTGGGEPFLYSGIEEAIRQIKSRGIWLSITSNATLLNKDRLALMGDLKVDELSISLWAASERTYKALHPKSKSGDFYRILESIKALRQKLLPQISLLNVISTMNLHEIDRMADLAHNLKADSVYFTLVDSMPDTQSLVLNAEQRQIALEHLARLKEKFYFSQLAFDNLDGFESRLREGRGLEWDKEKIDQIPCAIGWHFARITADGSVVPCCRGVKYPMGNLNVTGFRQIWGGSCYAKFRRKALNEKKTDAYFADMNCYKMCDNLMHNEQLKKRVEAMSPAQISLLQSADLPTLEEHGPL